ncbi:MAG: cell division protein FtsZ, partial [Verrucomicrobiales bacterium]|nr:cell division protein FtsZ [Verrucomicrobiales bacterium]
MIAFDHMQTEIPDGDHYDVTVIGVGGAGSNVIDRLALDGMGEAEIVCMNTDIRALSNSMANRKIQLGRDVTKGLGAGGDPELGAEVAEASEEEIRDIVQGRDIIFICVGLGGVTGSGAAPYVARLAREAGAFVVVFAIMPFGFEGRRRRAQADEALELLSEPASALLTFENGRMGELVLPKEGIQAAFAAADEVIGQSVRAVTGIVLRPGLIRIGMDDLIRALENDDSRCLFGYGEATGESRAQEALTAALRSPLLERGVLLSDSRNVLVHVTGGKTMTLIEVELLMTELGKQIGDDAQILFGTGHDPKLGDRLAVTVISSLAQVVEPAVEEVTAAESAAAVGVELAVEEEAIEVVEACGDVRNRGSADGVELGLDDVSVDRAPRVERTVAAAAMADIEEVVAETLLDLGMDEAVADRREPEEEEDVVGLEEFVEIEEGVAAPVEVAGREDSGKEGSGVEEPAVEKAVVIEEAEEPEEPEEAEEADEVKVAVNEEVKKESEEAFDPSGECLT